VTAMDCPWARPSQAAQEPSRGEVLAGGAPDVVERTLRLAGESLELAGGDGACTLD